MRTATDSLDAALDDALKMTFPASDPVALFMADPGRGTVAPDRSRTSIQSGPDSRRQIGQPNDVRRP
jgi:hypothetical protein